jgi:peptidoglycan/LPS O-acetylase OafA/YrhL
MFSRPLFVFGLALILMPCFLGQSRLVRLILGADFFAPLARLTFSIYLVHIFIIGYFLGSSKQMIYLENYILVFLCVGVTIISTIVAIPFSLLFEVPFMNLEKYVLFYQKPRKPKAEKMEFEETDDVKKTLLIKQDK